MRKIVFGAAAASCLLAGPAMAQDLSRTFFTWVPFSSGCQALSGKNAAGAIPFTNTQGVPYMFAQGSGCPKEGALGKIYRVRSVMPETKGTLRLGVGTQTWIVHMPMPGKYKAKKVKKDTL